MRYQGGKSRISKEIATTITKFSGGGVQMLVWLVYFVAVVQ